MCLIVLAWQAHSEASLLMAANRDEFHARPTRAAEFWAPHPEILAGLDLLAGGTWLGITRSGRFAALTNVRDLRPQKTKPERSRGELTRDFLAGHDSPLEYLEEVASRSAEYQGFNLIVGDGESLCYLHAARDQRSEPMLLAPGVYGLSNASLDVPWPKVSQARSRLGAQLVNASGELIDHDALGYCLNDRTLLADEEPTALDVDPSFIRQLSAQFIVTPAYGTRCCTTLRYYKDKSWDFRELRFDAQGQETGRDNFKHQAAMD